MPANLHYIFGELPYDRPSVEKWAPKYVDFRMQGLKDGEFSLASYESEAKLRMKDWIDMLSRPSHRIGLCASYTGSEPPSEIWDAEWAGTILLYGPAHVQAPVNATASHDIVWFLSSLYVAPTHRTRKIAIPFIKKIINLKHTYPQKDLPPGIILEQCRIRVQGIVRTDLISLFEHYKKMGMTPIKVMKRAEYLKSWGIPVPLGTEKQENWVLESVKDCSSAMIQRSYL